MIAAAEVRESLLKNELIIFASDYGKKAIAESWTVRLKKQVKQLDQFKDFNTAVNYINFQVKKYQPNVIMEKNTISVADPRYVHGATGAQPAGVKTSPADTHSAPIQKNNPGAGMGGTSY